MKGENTVVNQEKARVLAGALASGLSIDRACQVAGISRPTFYRWQDADPDFRDQMEQARARSELAMLALINRAANKRYDVDCPQCGHRFVKEFPTDWRAAVAWLELVDPAKYKRRFLTADVHVEQDVRVEHLIALVEKYVPRDDLDALLEGRSPGPRLPAPLPREPDLIQ